LNSLAFVPTIMTLGNLVCGFAAIHFAMRAVSDIPGASIADHKDLPGSLIELMLPSFLSVGAGLVILGMVFDCLDGLLARMTRSTTDFGGQLDSLADIVSFGVAPATLMVAFMTSQLAIEDIYVSPVSVHVLGRFAWASAAVYVAFTAVRLARYNVEHARADFDHRTFRGLPSPGAAAVMVSLVLFQDQEVGMSLRPFMVYGLPAIALVTAFLMVSPIPYKRFHRAYLLGKQPFGQFVGVVIILAIFLVYKAPTMVLLVLWYWASGPVGLFYNRLKRGRRGGASGKPGHTNDQANQRPSERAV
jgi:CDP-diacylglycerol--serine O-phosphatidyltransferase